jgi:hypothetical protein
MLASAALAKPNDPEASAIGNRYKENSPLTDAVPRIPKG